MVGRQTSQRCDTCRKRKIKCDLDEPACTPCQKAGWTCPGYDTHARFHQLTTGYGRKPAVHGQRHTDVALKTTSLISQVPMSPTDKLRSELVLKSQAGQLSARFVVIPESSIMQHLPRRLGQNMALDNAVKLICTTDPAARMHAYGTSLRSLQDSIDCGLSSEALGAATLLQMHDFFQNASHRTWAVHAGGVIKMLKTRGPHGVKTGFDKCLLQAQVGNIAFDALRERRPCFLSLPEWNSKIRSLNQEDGVSYSWEMSLIAVGVHVPSLICRFEALANARRDGPSHACPGLTNIPSLFAELHRVRQEIEDALARVPAESAGTNRIRPALLLSANTYLAMIDYMLDEVEIESGVNLGAIRHAEQASHPNHISHIMTLDMAKALYRRLHAMDAVASQTTADMLKLTLHRVLGATDDAKTKAGPMSVVIDEMYRMLSSPPEVHQYSEGPREQDAGVEASAWETARTPM